MMAQAVPAMVVDASDERAIIALLIRYATGIDMRDWALFRSCFTEDFEGDYGRFGTWKGPREITEYMKIAHMDMGVTLHRVSNIVVQRHGGQTQARSYIDAILTAGIAGAGYRVRA